MGCLGWGWKYTSFCWLLEWRRPRRGNRSGLFLKIEAEGVHFDVIEDIGDPGDVHVLAVIFLSHAIE